MEQAKKLIIVGDGEFAEVAYEYFTADSSYKVVAFAVEKKFITKDTLYGLPIVPFETVQTLYSPNEHAMFVAVTFIQLNRVRTRLYEAAKQKGYPLATYVSSHAFVWKTASIGENSFIFENNVIQHRVRIGNNVIMWSGNHIGHHTEIQDNCFFSSHVVVSGCCKIGQNCFFGVNSTLIDHLEVKSDCMIAAGALLTHNTEVGKIYKGHPAKADTKSTYTHYQIEHETVT